MEINKVHDLKCWPVYFKDISSGVKAFEIRKDDRGGYHSNDYLFLREWNPATEEYTGHVAMVKVDMVVRNSDMPDHIPAGIVLMGILLLDSPLVNRTTRILG